jgi:hypothetical protein
MPIERAEERLIHFRFVLGLIDAIGSRSNRRSIEHSQIMAAIALGELEGRPFRIAKLVEFLGMPRATVTARVKALIREGHIVRRDGLFFANPESVNSPEAGQITDQVTVLILQAANDLKKLNRS